MAGLVRASRSLSENPLSPLGKYPEDSLSLRERAGVRGEGSGVASPLTLTLSQRERE